MKLCAVHKPWVELRALWFAPVSLCLTVLFAFSSIAHAADDSVVKFPLGQQIEIKRADPGGPERVYEFALEPGTAVDISVSRIEVLAFEIYVFGPDRLEHAFTKPGELPFDAEGIYALRITQPFKRSERLSIVSESGGKYRLRLAPIGRSDYTVSISDPRPSSPADEQIMRTAALMFRIFGYYKGKIKVGDAIPFVRERVEIFRRAGDPYSLATALYILASVSGNDGDLKGSIAASFEARSLLLSSSDKPDALGIDPCPFYERLGEMQSWLECEHNNLALARSVQRPEREAGALRNLGLTYHMLADETRAREYFHEASNIYNRISTDAKPYIFEKIQLYKDLGNVKQAIYRLNHPIEFYPARTPADLTQAIAYYREGLELDSRSPSGFKGYFLWQIGAATRDLGDLTEASKYLEQALDYYKNSPGTTAIIWMDIARIHLLRGEKEQARELLLKALPLLRKFNASLAPIADLFIEAGEPPMSIEIHMESLEFGEKSSDVHLMARSHAGLARAERALGNFENSRYHILSAIELAESLRDRIKNDEVRSTYFAAAKRFYDFYVDLLMQLHHAQPDRGLDLIAFEASERSRSRNLLDLLNRSGIDVRQGVDPKYLDAERKVREKIAELHAKQIRLAAARDPRNETAAIRRDLAALVQEQHAVEAEIRNRSPRYASVAPAGAISAGEVQKLLDPQTVLLEYALGDAKSYLWIISANGVRSAELPSRQELEGLVTAMYSAVIARRSQGKISAAEIPASDSAYRYAAAKLGKALLGPIGGEFKGKRFLIVPDGGLNYIPWSALPDPASGHNSLIQDHEIVVLPSASVLDMLRTDAARRTPAPEIASVYADPVFTADDDRLRGKAAAGSRRARMETSSARRDLDLAISDTAVDGVLPRLSFSRREAEAILSAAGRTRSSARLDLSASKASVLGDDLGQYRIVHFATHGLVDNRNPSLSGLVMSLVDDKGNDVDGFLRLHDIYGLKLNADLVVLSACSTALGKEVRGEGLIGLTRGFMYAGAPRVIASLWKVNDVATAHFMGVFYRKLLKDKMRPAAALRAAQLEIMKQRRWRSPYFWAPFILQGDWK